MGPEPSQKAEFLYEELYGKYDSSMGNAETLMDSFCATYDSSSDEKVNYSAEQRQISDRAVTGFETCIKAASNGITITPAISSSHISLTFGSGGNALKLISVSHSNNFKCSGNDGQGDIKNIGTKMVVALPPLGTAKFDCDRSITTTSDGKAAYLPSEFSIGVGYGSTSDTIPISLPGDNLVTPANANDLNAKIQALAAILQNHGMVVSFARRLGFPIPLQWDVSSGVSIRQPLSTPMESDRPDRCRPMALSPTSTKWVLTAEIVIL